MIALSLRKVIKALNIKEFQGTLGVLYVDTVISIWEAASGTLNIVDSAKALASIMTATRDGFRLGLASVKSRAMTVPKTAKVVVKKTILL